MREWMLAAKSAPDEMIFEAIERAGIRAVEIYTNGDWLRKIPHILRTCAKFPFRYAIHAPEDIFEPEGLAAFARDLRAEVVVFHDIYWENEWERIAQAFGKIPAKICIENTRSIHDPLKLIRRYGFYRCLDLEHLQMECNGVYEEPFVAVMRQARHVHLTGYTFGSKQWHTPVHYAPEHNRYLLGLLGQAGYSGFVVSEADVSFQNFEEFEALAQFMNRETGIHG